MTEIKFARDYGYAPGAPFWLVWNQDARMPSVMHEKREAAEAEAARLASITPGATFHVLACMSSISTDVQVVGTRFDPNRAPAREVDEAFLEATPSAPAFLAQAVDDEVAF